MYEKKLKGNTYNEFIRLFSERRAEEEFDVIELTELKANNEKPNRQQILNQVLHSSTVLQTQFAELESMVSQRLNLICLYISCTLSTQSPESLPENLMHIQRNMQFLIEDIEKINKRGKNSYNTKDIKESFNQLKAMQVHALHSASQTFHEEVRNAGEPLSENLFEIR